ncbi:ABC-type multidrug transport system, ATPase component [Desulfitobacterium dehalogenans ATCC 51507]|uniref:ABC-type multidrug transport system, ATPase component n=1 Tax=Desulfitobacterium dehalogenans (strain ATCC 51507 / DSM 9161 / JW/IU-DC1) TaxID=756499 RepID=I4A8B8_DESDJ|nr:ABC transporter ATP-binding protein [Desulfitobacterium dehalogenans]AFM00203.1 ABC-type multidrug transport system, ATPase component [Desulfitobacterium dehalogenans ATCC 51507]
MVNVLEVKNLSKKYNEFQLKNVKFSLPQGCIMGLVGENGAGKSTTIKLLLNLIRRDGGEVEIFGKDNLTHEREIKEDLGVVFDESNFPDNMNAIDISLMMKNVYKNWDQEIFEGYLRRFALVPKKKVKDYSRGMKMKLSIAVALSHHPRFLILDEPTSGLDPMVREEILDIFLEFIQNEEHSILISSHIISDLEKIADYITFIHSGEVLFSEAKDQLLEDYGILKCSHTELDQLDKELIIGYRKNQFGIEALVKRKKLKGKFLVDSAGIEDIMLFYSRGAGK